MSVQSKIRKQDSSKGQGSKWEFPADLVRPIGQFLREQLGKLERRKMLLSREDPLADGEGAVSRAAIDAQAAESFGHARVFALKKDIDRKIIQVRKALSRIKIGKYGICENCGRMIDTDRLMIYPEATLCITCEKKRER